MSSDSESGINANNDDDADNGDDGNDDGGDAEKIASRVVARHIVLYVGIGDFFLLARQQLCLSVEPVGWSANRT